MAVSFMRNASGHNYGNSSFIVDVAMGQIPRSTERISSYMEVCMQFSAYDLVFTHCRWRCQSSLTIHKRTSSKRWFQSSWLSHPGTIPSLLRRELRYKCICWSLNDLMFSTVSSSVLWLWWWYRQLRRRSEEGR